MKRMNSLRIGVVAAALSALTGTASADVVSDQPAAILIWPDVISALGEFAAPVDTVFQITNTSLEPVLMHCFHENANYHCSNTGEVCLFAEQCCEGSDGCGTCDPGWLETDFWIRLTPRQPLGWVASEGMGRDEVPLTGGIGSTGIGGASNAGTNIPPVAEQPYNGTLKCITVNEDGSPSDRNVVKGESTRIAVHQFDSLGTVAKHNAIGIRAIEGAVNDDNELVLGGGGAEYEGCPEQLIVNHMFDGVVDPIIGAAAVAEARASGIPFDASTGTVLSRLTMVPCTQDLLRQVPGSAVAQFLVYNEFEQRFSTSRTVECKFEKILSLIDTTDPERSIFSAGVSGTVVGQSRIRAVGSGLVGVLTEVRYIETMDGVISGGLTSQAKIPRRVPAWHYLGVANGEQADVNIHQQGDRAESDIITIP